MDPSDLDERLAALEARAPAPGAPPGLASAADRRRLRAGRPTLVAAGLVVIAGASAVGAGALMEPRAHEGVQNPGQPLHGARMECMSPREAEHFLVSKGFTDVVWQVESGSSRDGRSVHQRSAPVHGYVVPGAIVDGTLYMVVDEREDSTGVGDCADMKMP